MGCDRNVCARELPQKVNTVVVEIVRRALQFLYHLIQKFTDGDYNKVNVFVKIF